MTFLNFFMLFGALAAAAPLIIHLLNRSKYEIIDWGAMHLLQPVFEENHRRIKIYELLLLLIRCLIPIVLALCLARPLISHFAIGNIALGGSRGSIETLVILDDSISMNHLDGSEQTRLQRAAALIDDLRQQLGGETSLTISPTPNSWPPASSAGVFDLRQNLFSGLNQALEDRTTAYEILVISDFQTAGLSSFDETAASELSTLRQSIPKTPTISLLPIRPSNNDLATKNLAITNLQVDSNRIVAGETVSITADLVNQSAQSLDNTMIELLVDSQVATSQMLNIAANTNRPISFEVEINKPSSASAAAESSKSNDHLLTIRCLTTDDCQQDNVAHQVVTVAPSLRAAIIAGLGQSTVASEQVSTNAADFLTVALSPFAFAGAGTPQADRISVIRITADQWHLEELNKFKVLILVDPGQLDQESEQRIYQYINQGGNLLMFAGPRFEASMESWNKNAFAETNVWIRTHASSLPVDSTATTSLDNARSTHPTMQMFNSEANGELFAATFQRWIVFDDLQDDVSVIARFSTGAPFAIESPCGAGAVIVCATTADTTWNNLPLRPAYLPLMQGWVEYLANRNLPAKQAVAGNAAQFLIPPASSLDGLRLLGPTDEALPIESTDPAQNLITGPATRTAGVYRLQQPEQADQFFVATVPREELTAPLTSATQLGGIAEQLAAEVPTTIDQYLAARNQRAVGTEIWHWIWWCVLGLMIAERFVVWMLGRVG